LAFCRDERLFSNLLLVEIENGDWAQTILRQYLFSQFQFLLFQELKKNADSTLSSIAERSLKEISYHVRWSKDWVLRLGDGTNESKARLIQALKNCWPYIGEMFKPASYEVFINIDWDKLQTDWKNNCIDIFTESTLLNEPGISELLNSSTTFMHTGGKTGFHTEAMGPLLAELQFMQRAYPNSSW
jgi:ring-1,2-phenylacetyl-CoA epoxidase subunit PaaC